MNHISELSQLGTSTWLDDLSRERLLSGNLKEIISSKSIVGVTTNPAIFAAAMTTGTAYDAELSTLKEAKATADEAVYALAIEDVKNACDLFADIYSATGCPSRLIRVFLMTLPPPWSRPVNCGRELIDQMS